MHKDFFVFLFNSYNNNLDRIWITYFTIQLIFATIHKPTALFGIIHRSYSIISVNFYIYLQYFQQKIFSFNKISGSQTDP